MSGSAGTVLVFGATGMFGRALGEEARRRSFHAVGASRRGPDVSVDICDVAGLTAVIRDVGADIIINSAAVVSHAACEDNPGDAYRVNADAVAMMALAARESGAKFVQVSTDHYYTGDGDARHPEDAPVTLLNAYARTKYAGEAFALANDRAMVMRTNITGFRHDGPVVSFIEWVFNALESEVPFNLFSDYYASTISTAQAAAILFDLVQLDVTGVINVACREVASKQGFVEAIARHAGADTAHAKVVSVHDHLAGRADSVGLDVSRAEALLGRQLPDLEAVARQLVGERRAAAGRTSGTG